MPKLSTAAWTRKLTQQFPGWGFWWAVGGFYAVPAPDTATSVWDLVALPNRIGPYKTPSEIKAAVRARYGWNDWCAACGRLARLCGHLERHPGGTVNGAQNDEEEPRCS